mmetsp:Transcript_24614/g.37418  ORF Transcript_24614/g.37418 Transcript_24614/m.37418 type:complete len:81 (-) Transcript_24614:728-970(-)
MDEWSFPVELVRSWIIPTEKRLIFPTDSTTIIGRLHVPTTTHVRFNTTPGLSMFREIARSSGGTSGGWHNEMDDFHLYGN